MFKPFVAGFMIFLTFEAFCGQPDQTQESYDRVDDGASGDNAGQFFVAGETGLLVELRLIVSGAKWSGNYPFGSDERIRIRKVAEDGTPIYDPVSTGMVYRSAVQLNTPQWVTVPLDPPYHQTQGEKLCFMMEGLSGGGSHGWNNYGVSTVDSYTNGFRFISIDFQQHKVYTSSVPDFAFETIVHPSPLFSTFSSREGTLKMELTHTFTNYVYHLWRSTNLLAGEWQYDSSKTGTVDGLEWRIPSVGTGSKFYRVAAEEMGR